MHRPDTDEELPGMLGDSIADAYRTVQHDAFDEDGLVSLVANDSYAAPSNSWPVIPALPFAALTPRTLAPMLSRISPLTTPAASASG